jgi:hypothetical protein
VRRLTRVEHLAHVALYCVVLRTGQDIREAPSAQLVFGEPEHLAHAVIDTQAQHVPVMDRQGKRRLGERPVHEGHIGLHTIRPGKGLALGESHQDPSETAVAAAARMCKQLQVHPAAIHVT